MRTIPDGLFEIVPAVKKLELRNIGCWTYLDLEFVAGLNIIKEDCCGSGKTTILRAITQAIFSSTQSEHRLCPTWGSESGSVMVEFMSPTARIDVDLLAGIPESQGPQSGGQCVLTLLRKYIYNCSRFRGMALLIEDGILSILDLDALREAINLLNDARCQIICLISHFRDRMMYDFSSARIYQCFLDHDGKPGVRLQQAGRRSTD